MRRPREENKGKENNSFSWEKLLERMTQQREKRPVKEKDIT